MSLEINYRIASNADVETIKALVFSILCEYGLTPDPDETDADISDVENNYIKRGGIFEVLVAKNDVILGTVGLYPMNAETVELRKMYFAKELRGQGFGKQTLQRMIEKSRELGFKKIYLQTASPLVEAIGLYKKFGFAPTGEMHAPRCDQAYFLNLE